MYLRLHSRSLPLSIALFFKRSLFLSLSHSVPPSLASALPLFLSAPLLWLLQLVAMATEGLSSFRQQWSGARGCHHPTLFPSFSLSLFPSTPSFHPTKCSHLSHPSYSSRFILPICDCVLLLSASLLHMGQRTTQAATGSVYSIPAVIDLQTSRSKYQSDRNMLPLQACVLYIRGRTYWKGVEIL